MSSVFDPFCPADTLTKTICVLPLPDSEFTSSEDGGCTNSENPLIVDFDNTSNTLDACGPDADYLWEVGYAPGECGSNPGFSLRDRTPFDLLDSPSFTDQDVRIQFDSAGTYVVYLTTTNECGVDTDSTTITVAGAPIVRIMEIPDSCTVQDFTVSPTLSFNADCFSVPDYRWEFPGGSPDSGNGESPGTVTYDEPGQYTIRLIVDNACGANTVTEQFELFAPPPIPNITVTTTVCTGGSISAIHPLPPDPESNLYSWVGPNGFTSMNDTWEINPATAADAGTYTLTVRDQNGCVSTRSYTVEVTNSAPINIAPNPAEVCVGDQLTLTASGGVTYEWDGDNLSDASGSTIVFTGDVIGEYEITVEGTDPAGECNGTDTLLVTVFSPPEVDAGAPRLGCVGQDFQFNGTPAAGTGTMATWSGDNVTADGFFNADAPGQYMVTYTYADARGCTGTDTTSICVREVPVANFDLDQTTGCLAGGFMVRATNSSNTLEDCAAVEYNWEVTFQNGECNDNAGFTFAEGTTASSIDPVISFTASGVYTLRLTISSDCGVNSEEQTITVADLPTVVINEYDAFCGITGIDFMAAISSCDAEISTYEWTFTGGIPGSSDLAVPPTVTYGIGEHSVSLSVTNACGTMVDTEEFRVLEGPALQTSVTEDTVCVGAIITPTGTSTGSELAFNWSFAGPGNIAFSSTTVENPTIDFSSAAPGEYVLTLTVSNSVCDPIERTFEVFVITPPVVTLAAVPDGCGMTSLMPVVSYGTDVLLLDSIRYEVEQIMGADAGAMIYSGTAVDVIDVVGAGTYTLTVTAFNRCAPAGISETVTFLLSESPTGFYEADTDFVCRGADGTVTMNAQYEGDITGYDWTITHLPTSQVISTLGSTEENPVFTFTDDLPLGDYRIAVNLANELCGNILWDTIIRVNALPSDVTIDPITDACTTLDYLPRADYGEFTEGLIDSVRWTFPDGSNLTTSGLREPPLVTQSITGTDLEVTLTLYNACGESTVTTSFDLLVGPDVRFTLDTNFVCTGDILQPGNLSTGDNLDYFWSVEPATGVTIMSPTDAEPAITFSGPAGDYTVQLSVGNDLCGRVETTESVRVSERPGVMIVPQPDYCDSATVILEGVYTNEAFTDSVRWEIRDENSALLFSSTSFAPAAAPLSVGVYTVTATVSNGCGEATDTDIFQVFTGPDVAIDIDTSFVCLNDTPTVTVINNSVGDSLSYQWVVTGGNFTISNDQVAEPIITFQDTGTFVISVAIANPVCAPVFWSDTVVVGEAPTLQLAPIADDCGEARFTPEATFSNLNRLDSLRWYFPGAANSETSTLANPGELIYPMPGTYTVSLVGYSTCGQDSVNETFRVLEPLEVAAEVDTNFSCLLPFLVSVTNLTSGDDLSYDWSVEGPFAANVNFDPGLRDPVFTIRDTGVYVISLRVFNEVCGEQFWRDTVTVLAAPVPLLTDLTEFCEAVSLEPIINYQTYRIDSVRWEFPGSGLNPATSTDLYPSGIPYSGAGSYTYAVTAYNVCGALRLADTFVIDTIPEIVLGPADTVCRSEGPFMLQAAIPAGGFWRDSLDRAGVISEAGLFDPDAAGGGVTVVEYVFRAGECEVITQKDILVVDLSFVMVDPPVLNACVSETAFMLNNGTPGPGWYVGPGVTDSLGVMNPNELGLGAYTLTYFFQLAGTQCIETRDFIVNVQPPPAPAIMVTDSICVNVPTDLLHSGSGGVAFEWQTGDGSSYFTENTLHTFIDTGLQRIQLIATSEYGCRDSIGRDVFVSGPPVAQFTKDTTMGCALLPVNFDNESIGFEWARYRWDFGNGETSTLENPPTVLYDQGLEDTTYFITLLVQNACGEDLQRDSVIVFPSPRARIALSQTEGCTPLFVEFTNLTTGQADRYEWYIDGQLYSQDSLPPDNTFIAPDSTNVYYDVMLVAYNECGSDTSRQTVSVLPNDIRAFFTVDDQRGCSPYAVQFRNFSDPDSLITYDWFFGDGSTSNLVNPAHTFESVNDSTTVYQVILVADNGCGQDSITIPITVEPAPEVIFEMPPISCAEDTVFFTNFSVDVVNPIWVFGDGDTLTMVENPGHVYEVPGSYTVELTAFAVTTGCPGTWTETVTVRAIPEASLSAAPLFGCPPLEVTIENLSTGGDFYTWDFGDGNTTVGPGPTEHTYNQSGLYPITLRATDEFGCSNDTVFEFVQVYDVPLIEYETEGDRPCGIPVTVCFENNSELGGDYRWNFGNGETSNENNPCVVYEQPGEYEITLVATNEFLCTTTETRPFTVYGVPIADFSIPNDSACAVATVSFMNTSVFADYVEWTFSDGFVTDELSPTRILTDTGTYDVRLIVGNASGCADTLTRDGILKVFPSPIADFEFEEQMDMPRTTIAFFDLSSEDAIRFGWDFDDGTGSTEMDPLHRYLSSFDKEVAHWVVNEFNCSDTAHATVDLPVLGELFIPNIFEPDDRTTAEKNVFLPKGIGLADFYISVYSRTGQLVWESDALDAEGSPTEGWDGTFQGRNLAPGTYVWKVERATYTDNRPWLGMPDENGELRSSGYLYLVR